MLAGEKISPPRPQKLYPNGFAGAPQSDGFAFVVVATGFGATACVVVTTLGFDAALVAGAAVDGVADVAGATGDGVLRSIVAG